MTKIDDLAYGLAVPQLGSVARRQLRDADVSRRTIQRRVNEGSWGERVPGVVDLPGFPDSWRRAVWRVVLSVDGWASHATAAHVLHLKHAPQPKEIEVVRLRATHPECCPVQPHETVWLPDEDRHTVEELPVTAAARTIADTCALAGFDRTLDRLHDAIRRGLTDVDEIKRVIAERRRRPGVDILRQALFELHPDAAKLGSWLEVDGLSFLRRFGFDVPVLQRVVRDRRGRFVARVDGAYDHLRLALEWDGDGFHLTPSEVARDRARDARLRAAGWEVFHVPTAGLSRREQAATAARLAAVIARRRRELGI